MRLIEAEFTNWCQHQDTTVKFAEGMTAIRGPNGSGKSNLLNGISFAITGDFSRNSGLKADNIYQLASARDKAGVIVKFNHGVDCKIERWLRPSKQAFYKDGVEKPWTGSNEILHELSAVLGVNERILLDYVFVGQWQIFSFIDQSPGVRAKAFAELFGADKAETVVKALTEHKISVSSFAIDIDRVKERIRELKTEYELLVAELEALKEYADWDYSNDPDFSFIEEAEAILKNSAELADNKKELWNVRQQIEQLTPLIEAAEELVRCRSLAAETTKDKADAAKADLGAWDSYATVDRFRVSSAKRLEELQTKWIDTLEAPEAPDCYSRRGELNDRAELLKPVIDEKLRLLELLEKGLSECPQCGQSVSPLQAQADTLRKDYDNLLRARKDSLAKLSLCKKFDDDLELYNKTKTNAESEMELIRQTLAGFESIKQPTENQEELLRRVTEHEEATKLLSEAEADLTNLNLRLKELTTRQRILDQTVARLSTESNGQIVFTVDLDAAKNRLRDKKLKSQAYERVKTKSHVLETAVVSEEAKLAEYQIEETKAAKHRKLAEHFDEVKDVMKGLPKLASQFYLESIRAELNDVLDAFDATFRVQSIDELRFILRKRDGTTTPAERLSGGERVVFALAFRIVVNSICASQLGLLCLDEPTAGLDEHNLRCVEVALGRLRELSQSRGLQVILITHEKELDHLFDRVITLPVAA